MASQNLSQVLSAKGFPG